MIRAILQISGKVQMVGFRSFLIKLANSLDIKGFAENLPDGKVKVVSEGSEENIEKFINNIKVQKPSYAQIEDIKVEYRDYKGEFSSVERIGEDVPRKDADMLEVMRSFDSKAEKLVVILSEVNETLKSIKETQEGIKETQDKMKITQEEMKDDIKEMKDDIKGIKQDTSQIRKDTSLLPSIKENTEVIKEKVTSLEEIQRYSYLDLRDKYDKLSAEVAEIKVTIKKLEASS
ncbi:MAG: acylphosphatase [Methanosarcinales archaeon]